MTAFFTRCCKKHSPLAALVAFALSFLVFALAHAEGIEVRNAALVAGEEGYFLGDTEPYDVVILDIGLPKMDGISILEQWRRSDRKIALWPICKIIVLPPASSTTATPVLDAVLGTNAVWVVGSTTGNETSTPVWASPTVAEFRSMA
jgi:CheY-like chemotaxis protein